MFHGDKLGENETYMYTVYVKVLSTHIFIAGNFVNIIRISCLKSWCDHVLYNSTLLDRLSVPMGNLSSSVDGGISLHIVSHYIRITIKSALWYCEWVLTILSSLSPVV